MKNSAGNNGRSGNNGYVRPSYTNAGNVPVRVGGKGKQASSKKSSQKRRRDATIGATPPDTGSG